MQRKTECTKVYICLWYFFRLPEACPLAVAFLPAVKGSVQPKHLLRMLEEMRMQELLALAGGKVVGFSQW